MSHEYECVVVGAGIVGSWTALSLAKLGKKVLLLEQFEGVHTRGSSHGYSRLTRSCYAERYFAELMPHALRIWKEIEEETGKQLIERCGVLCVTTKKEAYPLYSDSLANMQDLCPDGLETKPDVNKVFLNFDNSTRMFKDKTGGAIYAQRALLTVRGLFLKYGGELRERCTVSKITQMQKKECLHTNQGQLLANSVVVCAGAWTKNLLVPDILPHLPLQPAAVQIYYWKLKQELADEDATKFPAILDISEPNIYSIPSMEYPNLVKVCIHASTNCCHPNERDRVVHDPKLRQELFDYVRKYMPCFEPEPAITETCMYTLTPDETFIIDYVPGRNIVFGAGFSGTGFKTSPAVGKLLSEMATGQKPFFDLSHFSMSRFKK